MNHCVLLTNNAKKAVHCLYTLELFEVWTLLLQSSLDVSIVVKSIWIHRESFDRSHSRITGGSSCSAQPQPTSGRDSGGGIFDPHPPTLRTSSSRGSVLYF
eukprot:2157479-Amphidinium_carterae.2